jgi:hypothetical protein
MSEVEAFIWCVWIAGGLINWHWSNRTNAKNLKLWQKVLVGLPASLLLGIIPLLPALLGMEDPRDRH